MSDNTSNPWDRVAGYHKQRRLVEKDRTTTSGSNHQITLMERDPKGHTQKKANTNITKQALEWNPQEQRKHRRPE